MALSSNWLGHHPLKVETPVRVRIALQNIGPVAQRQRQQIQNLFSVGSNPTGTTTFINLKKIREYMWLIYALMMLDNLEVIALTSAILSGAVLVIMLIFTSIGEAEANQGLDEYRRDVSSGTLKILQKIKKGALLVFIPSLLIAAFVPNSKQAAIIFTAGSAIEYVQNNEKLQELPDKTVECLNKFIDEYLDEPETTTEHN